MKTYKILHLFKDLLDYDGTRGDMIYMLHRLDTYGIAYEYVAHEVGETIDVSDFDFIYAGVSPQKYEKLYLQQLKEHVHGLQTYIESGKIMLAIEQSFMFLGSNSDATNSLPDFCGFIPIDVTIDESYTIGNILLETKLPLLRGGQFESKINGFFNSRFQFVPRQERDMMYFGHVKLGQGHLWETEREGFCYKGFYGTQLRGPLLPRNYDFCDFLIQQFVSEEIVLLESNLEAKAKQVLTDESEAFIASGEQKKIYNYRS